MIEAYSIVQSETKEWGEEFKGAISQIESKIEEAKEKIKEPGAIKVTITNPEAVKSWNIQYRSRSIPCFGNTGVLTDVAPGIQSIQVIGQAEERQLSAAEAVTVEPGKVALVELTLV